MKCFNLSRREIADITKDSIGNDKFAWISIQEPGNEPTTNEKLDTYNTLKVAFWDTTHPVPIFNGWASPTNISPDGKQYEMANPPSEADAKTIVDFLLANKDKNIIVNCRAGISRSGAVAQFLADMMGYDWMTPWKNRAQPNTLLYRLMVDYFLSFNPPPTKIIDKRGNR